MTRDSGRWQAYVYVSSLELASLLQSKCTNLLCVSVTVQAY
jgi:hypothetical protein